MKKISYDYSEKLKKNIEAVSEKSKEAIRTIIDTSSKKFESALDENKKFIDSMEKQISNSDFVDTTIVSEVKNAFGNSVELAEEAIDTIIDIQSEQLQSVIDLNVKLIDKIKNLDFSDKNELSELLEVIEKNFETVSKQSIENTHKVTDIYNKHINLALNFNEKISSNIQNHVKVLNNIQNKQIDMANNWSSWGAQWWKVQAKEEVAV